MLKNYLLVALRALRKRPGYAFINVGGLGLGLACCFLIVLFLQHERSFDRFHTKADRIARALLVWEGGPKASTPAGLAPDLAAALPDVEAAVRVDVGRQPYLRVGGESRRVSGYALADPAFFEVFDFELLRGDPQTALEDPRALVLTERAAKALFGDADPMGQTVTYGGDTDLTVTGVVADPPATSTLDFDYLGSFEIYREWWGADAMSDYTNHNFLTYLLLRPGTDPGAAEAKAATWARERFPEWFTDAPADYRPVELQPLTAVHLTPGITFENLPTRDVGYLWAFGAIAALILLIAAVNFTNLATAQASQRAKEVGVRKAIGAGRHQLVGRFLGESVLLSAFAIVLALALVVALLPTFNEAVGADVALGTGGLGLGALLVGIGLGTGLLAGAYPALYLSAFEPTRVLKGEVVRGRGGSWLRRGLIVFQFAASIVLIVGALSVYQQLDYMRTRDLGFEGEHVLFFAQAPGLGEDYEAFRQELLASPHVQDVAWSTPPGRVGTNRGYNWPGQTGDEESGQSLWTIIAGPGYLETIGAELVAGREFVSVADTQDAYILNETAVRALGLEPAEAVGQPFRAWDRPMGAVVGVVEDFHFKSLHTAVEPVVINYKPGWVGTIAVRTAAGGVAEALDHVRATWEAFAPGYAFEYDFLDEDFGRAYAAEEQLVQRFGFFAAVAVFIACLGLFGLAAHTAERRRKEIGVRKVMGASVPQIVRLLAGEFARLVLVGFVVAAPVAYLVMDRWLGDFAYRVGLGPGVFLLAGGLALLIALATVSGQALRAAAADPVEALRYE